MSDLTKRELAENDTPDGNPNAKQILIAEDEPMIRSLLQKCLNRWGYRTLVAHDGKQALHVAEQHPGGQVQLILQRGWKFVQKPSKPSEIKEKIEEVLK